MNNDRIIFNQKTFDLICTFTLKGYSLKEISKIRGMPKITTLYSWVKRYKCLKFALKYCREFKCFYKEDENIENLVQVFKNRIIH